METTFTDEVLDNIFSYHAPQGDQTERYENIRRAARVFSKVLIKNTLAGADQTVAIRKLRECVFTANASIALEHKD